MIRKQALTSSSAASSSHLSSSAANESAKAPKTVPNGHTGAESVLTPFRINIESPIATTAKLPSGMSPMGISPCLAKLKINRDELTPERQKFVTRREGFSYYCIEVEQQKRQKLGLHIETYQNKVLVYFVDKRSVFFNALTNGDRIVDVNGAPVSDKITAINLIIKSLKDSKKVSLSVEHPTEETLVKKRMRALFESINEKSIREFNEFKSFHGFIDDCTKYNIKGTGRYYYCYTFGSDGKIAFYLILSTTVDDEIAFIKFEILNEKSLFCVGNYKYEHIRDMIVDIGLHRGMLLIEDDPSTRLKKKIPSNFIDCINEEGFVSPDLKIVKVNAFDVHKNFKELFSKCIQSGEINLCIKTTAPSQFLASDVREIGKVQAKKMHKPGAGTVKKGGIMTKAGATPSNMKVHVLEETKEHIIASDNEGKSLKKVAAIHNKKVTKSVRGNDITSPFSMLSPTKAASTPSPHPLGLKSNQEELPSENEKLIIRREGFLYNFVTLELQKGCKFGLGFKDYQNKVIVSRVDNGSIDGARLKAGDSILFVNALPVSNKNLASDILMKSLIEKNRVCLGIERPHSDNAIALVNAALLVSEQQPPSVITEKDIIKEGSSKDVDCSKRK